MGLFLIKLSDLQDFFSIGLNFAKKTFSIAFPNYFKSRSLVLQKMFLPSCRASISPTVISKS